MTQNQISYFKAKEEQRHNLATESMTAEMNKATAEHYIRTDQLRGGELAQSWATLGETKRHNTEVESYQGEQARAEAAYKQAQTEGVLLENTYIPLKYTEVTSEIDKNQAQEGLYEQQTKTEKLKSDLTQAEADYYAARADNYRMSTRLMPYQTIGGLYGNVVGKGGFNNYGKFKQWEQEINPSMPDMYVVPNSTIPLLPQTYTTPSLPLLP